MEPDIEDDRAYRWLAEGKCSDALAHVNNPDNFHGFNKEIYRQLYIAGAHACLGRVQEAEEAFQQAEKLPSSPTDWTGDITANRVSCLYNALVEYLQLDRPSKPCQPEDLTPEDSTTESTSTETTT